MEETITIPCTDGEFSGFLAHPEQEPVGFVVLVQEIFGVNQSMRGLARAYAKAGFATLCPDLFWRLEPNVQLTDKKEEDLQKAFDFFARFDVDTGVKDLGAARKILDGAAGVAGYCLGGRLAALAVAREDFVAGVSYYGVSLETHLDELAKLQKPLLLHMAEADSFVPPEAQAQILERLKAPVVIKRYARRDHAFARPEGDNFHAADAARANASTFSFLKTYL